LENRITKWYFEAYNFTLIHLWTKFLVRSEEQKVNISGSGTETHVHLDQVDPNWTNHMHGVNYVVLSGGHWFFRELFLYEHNRLIGTVYQTPQNVPALGAVFALQRVFRTAINYLKHSDGGSALRLVVLRTFSPTHFEGGTWNSGGSCHRTGPNFDLVMLRGMNLELRDAVLEEMERVRNGAGHVSFAMMDVTWMMEMRSDAHPGTHWDNRWNSGYSDCTHWCMPGAVDTWNQLLFHIIRGYQYGINL
jgi:xyloglucan O-acetyltransferase